MEEDHQFTITDRDNQIRAIQYENAVSQAQRDVQVQLQRLSYKDVKVPSPILEHVMYITREMPVKNNIIIIVRKHTTSANDKYHDLPYYVSRIQRRKMYVKLRWINRHFPDHEVIVGINSPNSNQAFNRFEKKVM